MTDSLTTTNTWLAILALVSLAEFLIIVSAGVAALRLYRKATTFLDRAEAQYVAPLAGKVQAVVSQAQETVHRIQQMEARANAMVTRVEETAGRVMSVAQYAWPVVGTWRAVAAAVGSFRTGHRPPARALVARPAGRP